MIQEWIIRPNEHIQLESYCGYTRNYFNNSQLTKQIIWDNLKNVKVIDRFVYDNQNIKLIREVVPLTKSMRKRYAKYFDEYETCPLCGRRSQKVGE